MRAWYVSPPDGDTPSGGLFKNTLNFCILNRVCRHYIPRREKTPAWDKNHSIFNSWCNAFIEKWKNTSNLNHCHSHACKCDDLTFKNRFVNLSQIFALFIGEKYFRIFDRNVDCNIIFTITFTIQYCINTSRPLVSHW